MARTVKQPIPQDHDWYAWERRAQEAGYGLVCGIDEAGRGPLAGPVCAAAVILPLDCQIPGLNDSKKLTEKKREALFDEICEKAVAYGIGCASEQEIDEINILQATYLAMKRAVEQLPLHRAQVFPPQLLDVNQRPLPPTKGEMLEAGEREGSGVIHPIRWQVTPAGK